MASPNDARAALLLLALALAGLGVRFAWSKGEPAGGVAYRAAEGLRPGRDSVAERARRLARPLQPGETIDVDRASAEELTRLPRIGPALAARIVADRTTNGPFGSLDALDRVSGIGPATLETLRPYATFSARSSSSAPSAPSLRWGGVGRLLVTLNTAPAESLAQLPGIGPTRARAIVQDRRRLGPYRTIADLERVRGIGLGTVKRLQQGFAIP